MDFLYRSIWGPQTQQDAKPYFLTRRLLACVYGEWPPPPPPPGRHRRLRFFIL